MVADGNPQMGTILEDTSPKACLRQGSMGTSTPTDTNYLGDKGEVIGSSP